MCTFNRIAIGFSLSMVCASMCAAARGQTAAQQPSVVQQQATKRVGEARERYVLLTNGQLIPGIVSETESEYSIEQQVGTMYFPKKRVEGAFDSVRHAYEYRLSQLPDGDSEERMKLALWCLNLKLNAEAGQLLNSVVELNPNNTQAKAMLISIEQAAARLARRERNDPAVRQTRVDPTTDGRPEALDSAVLRNAQRGLGVKDLPVIFDLPLPAAIKRTEEFNRFVHPLLQIYCAKCHDSQYQGEFQLVRIRGRSDRASDALRANLDATLRLIDPKNPSHSVLLSSTLRPHGAGAKRPIFSGSNDRAYKILAEWVSHLVAPKQADEAARREASRDRIESDEVFAVDRNRSGAVQSTNSAHASTNMASSPRQKPDTDTAVISQNPSDPQEFPIPFAVSGVMPKLPAPKNSAGPSAKRPSTAASSKVPGSVATTKPASLPDDLDDDDEDDDAELMPNPPKKKAATGAAKAQAKPLKIDPKLLERALQYRNANRANPGS
jgi:hypothetical protein